MISEQIFTIFDTETTGLYPHEGDKIIEIAAIKMKGKEVLAEEKFESFVNPERDIPYESTKVNNITIDMVQDAPKIAEVLPEFLSFVGDSILVAHNAEFDMGFISEALFQTNPFGQPPESICTKKLSRKISPQEKHHNLDTLSYRYNVPLPEENRHRALADVLLLAEVFQKLLDAGNVEDINQLRTLQ